MYLFFSLVAVACVSPFLFPTIRSECGKTKWFWNTHRASKVESRSSSWTKGRGSSTTISSAHRSVCVLLGTGNGASHLSGNLLLLERSLFVLVLYVMLSANIGNGLLGMRAIPLDASLPPYMCVSARHTRGDFSIPLSNLFSFNFLVAGLQSGVHLITLYCIWPEN